MKNVLNLLRENLKYHKDCLSVVEKTYAKGYMSTEDYDMYYKNYIPIIAEFTEAIEIIKKHSEK